MMRPEIIKEIIEQGLPGSEAKVQGDDGTHFEAVVICAEFAGKSVLKQHQMVYATLGDKMQMGDIHALGLKTFTPEAWATHQAS